MQPCHTYHIDYRLDDVTFYEDEIFVPCNSSYQELSHELLLDIVNLEASVLSTTPLAKARWEFVGSDPELIAGKTVTIYHKNEQVYEEMINRFGQFDYKELGS